MSSSLLQANDTNGRGKIKGWGRDKSFNDGILYSCRKKETCVILGKKKKKLL